GDEVREIRYVLEDGWPYLQVEVVYAKAPAGKTPVEVPLHVRLLADTIGDLPEAQNLGGVSLGDKVLWTYHRWHDNAYAVLLDKNGPKWGPNARVDSVTPSTEQETVLTYKLIPARNAFDALAIAAKQLDIPLREVTISSNSRTKAIHPLSD